MSNITRLPGTPDSRRRYQAGDIIRALTDGLRHEDIAEGIEQALENLLFVAGPEDVLAARELLSDLLYSLPEPTNFVEGVAINPNLPKNFGYCENESRPESHMVWWNRPYIETDDWESESWECYCARLASIGYEHDYSREEWDARQEQGRTRWFAAFPDGVRYAVYCLDGGAWDRPTGWGMVGTLDEALNITKTGPKRS